MTKSKNLRLVLAGLFLVLAGVTFIATEPAEADHCWFCISYDLCGESHFGSTDCTVTSGGHGCLPQCQEIGNPCFPGGW